MSVGRYGTLVCGSGYPADAAETLQPGDPLVASPSSWALIAEGVWPGGLLVVGASLLLVVWTRMSEDVTSGAGALHIRLYDQDQSRELGLITFDVYEAGIESVGGVFLSDVHDDWSRVRLQYQVGGDDNAREFIAWGVFEQVEP